MPTCNAGTAARPVRTAICARTVAFYVDVSAFTRGLRDVMAAAGEAVGPEELLYVPLSTHETKWSPQV